MSDMKMSATLVAADNSSKRLRSCQPPIGLIICDEGHRLKSKDNKTTKMFESLQTRRRISKIIFTAGADIQFSRVLRCRMILESTGPW